MQRWWLLARVLQFMKGEIPDPRNLIQDCKKYNLEDPRLLTLAQLNLEIHVCNLQIIELYKTTPQKRHKHLTSCIKEAEIDGGGWWLLARVLQFMKGEIPDPRNLIQDCKKYNLVV